MKAIFAFVVIIVLTGALSYIPSTTLAQTNEVEEDAAQDAQDGVESPEDDVMMPGDDGIELPPEEGVEFPPDGGVELPPDENTEDDATEDE